jgi:hypothetical protein
LSVDPSKPLVENGFNIIVNCIDKIYDKDSVYNASDYSKKELQEFVEQFTQDMYEKMSKFFDTMPSIYYESEEMSPYSQKKVKVVLDKFVDFFD